MSERERDKAELGREEAETGRVDAETERREAEGNWIDAETGRVDAETSRVDAETGRAESRGLHLRRRGVLVALALALVAVLPSLVGFYLLDREIQARCLDTQANRDAIRASITTGLVTLGYRIQTETGEIIETQKGPIDYYATRPDERADALDRTLKALTETFPTLTCNDGWF